MPAAEAAELLAGVLVAQPRTERRSRLGALVAADPGIAVALAIALVVSAASVVYFMHAGVTTALGDSRSRLLIARAVLEGRHAGLAQLGGIWPPFPQVYMLPFVWNDTLYYSGLAGAIPSALCYVVSSAFLYKLVTRLTMDPLAGLIGVVGFSGPNVLYLQSVPMSELPFIACFLGTVYFTASWMLRGSLQPLFLAGLMACLSTLTRYEGWVLAVLLTAFVACFCWRAGHHREEVEGIVLLFALVAFLGIALWVLWNRVIFGDWLFFLHSQYGTKATNSVQLAALPTSQRPAGNLPLAIQVFGWAAMDNVGPLVVCAAVLGLARLALARRFGPATVTAAMLLLFPVVFSMAAAYLGIEVIGDPRATDGGQLTNVRYGLLVAPAAGFLAGWLAHGGWWRWPVLAACVLSALLMWRAGLVNLDDTTAVTNEQGQSTTQAGEWLRDHYDGGVILMQRRSNENLLFSSRIPLGHVIYEGDRSEWTTGLRDPDREARWVVLDAGDAAQGLPADDVWLSLHDRPALVDHYERVYRDGGIEVYRRLAA